MLILVSYLAIAVGVVLVARALRTTVRASLMRVALALVLVGWLSNTVVIAANHGMPVSTGAIARAGGDPKMDVTTLGVMYKHVPATSSTILWPLGDVIAVPMAEAVPPLPRLGSAVVSPGDLILLLGIAILTFAWLQPASRSPMRGRAAVLDDPAH